eukprot:1157954-Pelagomonas_calceolata.AAC.3
MQVSAGADGIQKLLVCSRFESCSLFLPGLYPGKPGHQFTLANTLLDSQAAEQEAQRIVLEARRVKQERLREAKTEAEKEIAAYRAEREGLYQKKVSEVSMRCIMMVQ